MPVQEEARCGQCQSPKAEAQGGKSASGEDKEGIRSAAAFQVLGGAKIIRPLPWL